MIWILISLAVIVSVLAAVLLPDPFANDGMICPHCGKPHIEGSRYGGGPG